MQTSLTDTLTQLYKVSRTPRILKAEHCYLSDPGLAYILRWFDAPSKKAAIPDCTEDDIKAVIEFILSLLTTPRNYRGIIRMQVCVNYLIATFLNTLCVESMHQQTILYIAREFYNALNEKAKGNEAHIYKETPQEQDSELMYFHFKSYQDPLYWRNSICPLYQAYGIKFHLYIRRYEENNPRTKHTESTYKSHVRSLRYFFKHMPSDIRKLLSHDQDIPDEYIKAYERGLAILFQGEDNDEDKPERSVDYLAYFATMLAGRKIKRRSFEFRNTRQDLNPIPGFTGYYSDDIGSEIETTRNEVLEVPVNQLNEIVASHTMFSQSKHYKDWADIVHLRSFHFYWDIPHMTLLHYVILYDAMEKAWRNQPASSNVNEVIIVFLYLCIHTGIDPKRLIRLELSNTEADDEALELSQKDDDFNILIPSIVDTLDPEFQGIYFPTLNKVAIPIPRKISKALASFLTTQRRVFSYRIKGELKNLTLTRVEDFLKKILSRSDLYIEHQPIITLEKIALSFIPLYSSRFGLDPLICCHISGEDRHELYRSQMHYVYIQDRYLEERYLRTFHKVEMAIMKEISRLFDFEISRGIRFDNIMGERNMYYSRSKSLSAGGYGSSCIALSSYLSSAVNKLSAAIVHENDLINRYNLFCIYVYLAFQFSVGHRGSKIPSITWNHFSQRLGTIVINDKESNRFHEERCLPLPPVVIQLIMRLKSMQDDIRRHIYHNHTISRQNTSCIFFLLNQYGSVSDFTLNKAYGILNSFGLHFDFPHNMPRHYLKNYLYHAKISNDIADCWAGHQHEGRELLNITSTTIPHFVSKVALPAIVTMIHELGFATIDA